MASVDPTDLATQTLALQTFIKNSKYVELIVDTVFTVIPSLLGFGAASIIGSSVMRTAKEMKGVGHYIGFFLRVGRFIPPKRPPGGGGGGGGGGG
jgi:hypothetical protein